MRRWWMALGVGVPLVLAIAVVPFARRSLHAEVSRGEAVAIAKLGGLSPHAYAPPSALLKELDLTRLTIGDATITAAVADKKVARLTLDPALQHVADALMTMNHLPEAAVVVMDVQTGRILVYASHVEKGPARDLVIEATAPAASVFKVVTGTALVEVAGLSPDQRECYSGGEQRIMLQDLQPDPKRDRWCATLAGAMGRSINTIFARLALRNLKPHALDETAKGLNFAAPLPFDVPVQASSIQLPEDSLGFARTAAGFWNTTLSPLHAAWIAATVARGGEPVRPTIVGDVLDDGKVVWTAPNAVAQRRAMKPETAHAITQMMDTTVADGTSFRAFHDPKGRAFLPGVPVAGKTGTLTDAANQRFYTWFMGFAPSHPMVDTGSGVPRQVAFGVLVVNQPTWNMKANVLAREVLRAYFAGQKVPNVTPPTLRDGAPTRPKTNPSASR